MVATAVSISACSFTPGASVSNPTTQIGTVSGFPYHPLVYHLDLSTMAYQLYDQSLVWPFDPYYEELTSNNNARQIYMDKVHAWARRQGVEQSQRRSGVRSYRGPGSLGSFPNNGSHDPIIYDYSRISPRAQSISNTVGKWTEYLTPTQITASIKDTYRPTLHYF